MRLTLTFIAVLAALLFSGASAHADTRLRALLVIASNEKGESDPRLAAYERNLRSILRFESYRLAGEGSAAIAPGGSASIGLGEGQSLTVEAEKPESRGARIKVKWEGQGRSHMNTGLALRPGVPAVLGGPSTGRSGEVFAVILIAE